MPRSLLYIPLLAISTSLWAVPPKPISGIYPHLSMFNKEAECGTGALVPWAGKLWAITYAPHKTKGSTDKLYEIDDALQQTVRSESIGGTPANRMIHRESNQLFMGPYAIDAERNVRAIPYSDMFGRLTGNARHLTDPANKIYFATMEEAVYEVDVKTLAVRELWADEQKKEGRHSDLPGYHGKGLYSGQGHLFYSNDGEHGKAALLDPTVPSGVLAGWDGNDDKWTIVNRAQFADITGPGGIYGSSHPESDPLWSIGWDTRSLILMVLDKGVWHSYRLPKSSHSYDGAHGWNIEWPRIREIGEGDLMMTMHGMFWHFPKDFRPGNSAGIAPRSSYLKVIGDFCRWNDRVVLGCDDATSSNSINKRKAHGPIKDTAGQSQSNLVFLDPKQLDEFGPALGRGSVWLKDKVKAGVPSDPFLFSGFEQRGLQLHHSSAGEVVFSLQTDSGNGQWKPLRDVTVPAGKIVWVSFSPEEKGSWIRVVANQDVAAADAVFHFSAKDRRTSKASSVFDGIADVDSTDYLAGIVRATGNDRRTLVLGSVEVKDNQVASEGYYELDASMTLNKVEDPQALSTLKQETYVPKGVIEIDDASVLVVDDSRRRWRLPKNSASFEKEGAVPMRVAREVVTERDLLNASGTVYELPAENADGVRKIRPVATHHLRIADFTSYRGLMVMSGINSAKDKDNEHIIRSSDGKAGLWVGSIDDLWSLGKPVGRGGPWMKTTVQKDVPSDPYLMTGYDKKTLTLSHNAGSPVTMRVEVDAAGNGSWATYHSFTVAPGESLNHSFPAAYGAYWVRVVAETDCKATAQLTYE